MIAPLLQKLSIELATDSATDPTLAKDTADLTGRIIPALIHSLNETKETKDEEFRALALRCKVVSTILYANLVKLATNA